MPTLSEIIETARAINAGDVIGALCLFALIPLVLFLGTVAL
jgi:hypothetical protein